jgi:tetratricopeptide (TPR) repeat protein
MAELCRFEESLVNYRSLVQCAPDSSGAYLGLANAFQRLGRHEEAIDAFNAAAERDQGNLLIQYNLARVFSRSEGFRMHWSFTVEWFVLNQVMHKPSGILAQH